MHKYLATFLSLQMYMAYVYAQNTDEQNTRKPLEITIPYCDKSICKTSSGSPIPIDQHEQMRTVDIIDKETINDTTPERVEEIISYIPGAAPGVTQSGFNTSINIRGFSTAGQVFVNGHKDNERFFTRDFSTIEHVEVLKGHSAVLYGSGSPGGLINYITKKPQAEDFITASVSVGNRNLFRFSLDDNGKLNNNGDLFYRLVASVQDQDHFYDNASRDRWIFAPSVMWNSSDSNNLGFEVEIAHDNTPLIYGTVISNEEILFNQSYIDPRAKSDRDYAHARLYWDHSVNQNWSFHTTTAAYQTKRDDRHIGFFFKLDENTLRGFFREVNDDYSQYVTRAELRGTELGNDIKHNVTFGIEQNKDRSSVEALRILDFTLDAHNPTFDTDFSLLDGDFRDFRITNNEIGTYIFDHIEFTDQLSIHIGARHSSYEIDFTEDENLILTDQSTLSKSIGFNYHPSNEMAFYGSISESFTPNVGQDRNNNFFDPKEANQYEFGARKKLPQYGLAFNSTIFQTTQNNLLTTDPLDRDFKVLAGEQRHRGIELSATYSPTEYFTYSVGYAYLDAVITKNNDGLQGNNPTNSPKHSGYLRLYYTPPTMTQLRIHAGIVGISEREADRDNTLTVPGYGRFDLGADYIYENWKFSLSAFNILNKNYIATSNAQDDIYQGSPRTVIASLSLDF